MDLQADGIERQTARPAVLWPNDHGLVGVDLAASEIEVQAKNGVLETIGRNRGRMRSAEAVAEGERGRQ
jgi:hypothetical protein